MTVRLATISPIFRFVTLRDAANFEFFLLCYLHSCISFLHSSYAETTRRNRRNNIAFLAEWQCCRSGFTMLDCLQYRPREIYAVCVPYAVGM